MAFGELFLHFGNILLNSSPNPRVQHLGILDLLLPNIVLLVDSLKPAA